MPHLYDIESNGFLDKVSTVHCIVVTDLDSREQKRYNDQGTGDGTIRECLRVLKESDRTVGHYIQGYDELALKKVYGDDFQLDNRSLDTLILSKLVYPNLKELDFIKRNKNYPNMPGNLIGRHSLEAWGYRFKFPKDDYSARMKEKGLDPWAEWNQDMEDYCCIDVDLNVKLLDTAMKKGFSMDSIWLEHDVQRIINRQVNYGFAFDVEAARKLQVKLLKRKLELEAALKEIVKPFYTRNGKLRTPKKTICYKEMLRPDISEGASYNAVKLIEFNPGSRDQIANRLQKLYGWKPKAFGKDGKPSVDEDILSALSYPPVKLLLEYLMIDKRLGQLAEGKEACMRHVGEDGRMHGKVDPLGTVTTRMTHSKPNVAQTPANGAPYGKEFRALYCVPEKKKLVGADADALELRLLAGYMARWDKGAYIKVATEGDIHTCNMEAIGITSRDHAKTWFYAFIYGAGDYKLGTIIADALGKKKMGKRAVTILGRDSRASFERNLPALGKLVKKVKDAAVKRKRIRGLDGRYHPVRSDHAALNVLLQGAGAIIMKRALVIADEALLALGYTNSDTSMSPSEINYEFVANIHDELQVECDEDIAEVVAKVLEESILKAGQYYDFACPITGGADIGSNWSQTH